MHNYTIPGLDRNYCCLCKKWIVTKKELENLKVTRDKIQKSDAKKEWNAYVKNIEYHFHNCKAQ